MSKRLLLIGRSGCGKTTLTQALKGEQIEHKKTQSIDYGELIIDSPGEYAENHNLGAALALYSYEADIVALLIAADEEYSLFPPCITCLVNREVIGIVTKADKCDPHRAENWLRISGCQTVFFVDSISKNGLNDLLEYLKPTKNQQK